MPDTTSGTAYAPKPVRQRSFAGPIVLITLGVVFLLGNMRVITWKSIGIWFAHWWPLLLIFFGVVKLIEYYSAKRSGTQFRGLGAGGVLLVLFILFTGLIASGVARVNWNAVSNEANWDSGFFDVFGQEYNYSQTVEQDYPAGANLTLSSRRGDVTVTAWDQNKIKVEVTKKIRATSQDEANNLDKQSQVVLTAAGPELTLNANNDNKPISTDMVIYIPKKGALTVDTMHGDVKIQNHDGNVKVTDSHGDVVIGDITGSADVSMRHGDFTAMKVSGDVNLDGRLNDVSVAEVGGGLHMTGDYYGDMKLSKVAKGVTFKSSRTDLAFAKLDGDMHMESDTLRASTIEGPVRIATRSKDIELQNVNGNVDLKNQNATIQLQPAEKLGQITIDNRNGSVELTLPSKASFQIDAKTEKGDIRSDYNINTTSQHGNSSASGQVGNGGPKIQINSQHGDVTIRKAS